MTDRPAPRILVVDDDVTNLELVERRLEVDGFESVLVETGLEGEERALGEHFDAVLLDLRLPDTSGLDVLDTLQRHRPELPVVIMTAHGSEAIAVRALTAGAAGYLIKPISRKDLIAALQAALDRQRARTESESAHGELLGTVAGLRADVAFEERQRRELSQLLDALDEGVLLLDRDGRVEAINRVAMTLLRQPTRPADFRTLVAHIAEVRDDQDRPVPLRQGGAGEAPSSADYRVCWKDGSEQVFHVTAKPFGDPPAAGHGWMVVFRDVTARRDQRERIEALLAQQASTLMQVQADRQSEIEQAAESVERVKSSIIATLSHELRTPLNFIVGFGSVLADGVVGELTPEQAALVEKMLVGAERLTHVVEDLLDSAMLAAGMLEPALTRQEVGAIAREVTQLLRTEADLKHIVLAFEPSAAVEASVDVGFLRKIMRQLLDNALKFTEAGGRIGVRAEPHPATGEPSIAVTDSGIGIPSAELPRLFERFYQVEHEATRRFGGTGMGLATAKGLAEAMGARFEVDSEPGRGSTFRLVLARP